MSKNNRNRQAPAGKVQAEDPVKTAKDVEEGNESVATDKPEGGGDALGKPDDGALDPEAARFDEEERIAQERADADQREREERAAADRLAAANEASAAKPVEVRVLRDGHFGSLNDVVTIPASLVDLAEADGAVCSHPASVAEAKATSKGKGD